MKSLSELADSIKRGVEELAEENERLISQLSSTRADLHEGFKTTMKLQDEKDALLSVVSALESYMKDRGETCWIEVCVKLEMYRAWRRGSKC